MSHSVLLRIFLVFAFLSVIVLIVKRWIIPIRGFTQLALFTLSEATFICNKGIPCSNCPLSFGICPIGTTQRITFIPYSPFYITLSIILITGLVFGTLVCGWACPVGFIQDIFHAPRLKEIKVSNKFKAFRYFTLLLGVVLIFLELRFNFLSKRGIGVFHEVTIIGGGLLLTTAIFVKRPFCRILCPLGLIYGKLNKVSPIKVMLNKNKCSACGECNKVCISDINPVKEVNSVLCAKCFNCLKVCEHR
jgi:polyferredoxin